MVFFSWHDAKKAPSLSVSAGGYLFPRATGKGEFISSTNGYVSDPAGFADKAVLGVWMSLFLQQTLWCRGSF